MGTPLLGRINFIDRTQAQMDHHEESVKRMMRFTLPPQTLAKGEKVLLTDSWKDPDVVADVGMVFPHFHQLTGSCIGASLGNAIFTLSAVQRTLAVNPTKAMIPFWMVPYGRCRYNEGDRGQGEGANNSSAVDTMKNEGLMDVTQPGLPTFKSDDGIYYTSSLEMGYSDGASSLCTKWLPTEKVHLLGAAAPCPDTQTLMTGILNGYPGYDGCDYYCGNGSIQHASATDGTAYVGGHYDGAGGHSTCFLGVWNHPTDGILFLYSNNWPNNTYPVDPAGGGNCCVWMKEAEVAKLWSRYNGDAYLLSGLHYFPAQPKVMNYYV